MEESSKIGSVYPAFFDFTFDIGTSFFFGRVPSGYHLSHRLGYSAKKGYSYKYADLNTIKQHRKHHSIFGTRY